MVASTSPQGDKSPPQSPKQTAAMVKKSSDNGVAKGKTTDDATKSSQRRGATSAQQGATGGGAGVAKGSDTKGTAASSAKHSVREGVGSGATKQGAAGDAAKATPSHQSASKSSTPTVGRKSTVSTTTTPTAASTRTDNRLGISNAGKNTSVSASASGTRSTSKATSNTNKDAAVNAATRAQSTTRLNTTKQRDTVGSDFPTNATATSRPSRGSRAGNSTGTARSTQSSDRTQNAKTERRGAGANGNRRNSNTDQASMYGRGIRIVKNSTSRNNVDRDTRAGARIDTSSSTARRSDILSKKRGTNTAGRAPTQSSTGKNQYNRTYSAGGISGKGNYRTGGNEGGELKFKQDNRFRRRADGDSSNFSRSNNRSDQHTRSNGTRFSGAGSNRRGAGKPPFEKNGNYGGNRNRNNGPAGTLLKKGAVSSKFGGKKSDDFKSNRPWNRFDSNREREHENRGGNFRERGNRWGDGRGERGNAYSSDQRRSDRFAGRGSSFGNATPGMQGDVPFGEQRQSQSDWYKNREQRAKHDRERFDSNDFDKEIEMPVASSSNKSIPLANPIPKTISITEAISVSDLAKKLNIKGVDLVSKLVSLGIMASINNVLDSDTATLIAEEYGAKVNIISLYDETKLVQSVDEDCKPQRRPPVVTVMGHVDHGKTTLLDTIRKTNVVAGESGGITQHIAAYQVENKGEKITFIDTPGHAAFTLMRARGAQITDIVVLVVSADDGIMPQTKEAIDHARAAKVPIIVAINKIDLENSNVEQTKKQLSEMGLVAEEWGGEVIMCPVSALKGDGVLELLEAILVASHEMDCTALADKAAAGRILESRIDQGRGIVCSVLIQEGTLHNGDFFLAGTNTGKVRSIYDDRGNKLSAAYPSAPVEIIGFSEIPNAGDPFEVAADEREAKSISSKRKELSKVELAREMKPLDVEGVYHTIEQQHYKVSKVIVKGDVDGSVEAIKASLSNLQNDQVRLEVIHSAAGDVNENDVLLARASRAMIICFNIKPSARIQKFADQEEIEIRKYNIIYNMIDDMKRYISGMRDSEYKEVEIGGCEVRAIFSSSKNEHIIGAYVNKGKVKINAPVEVIRKKSSLFKSTITSLKRFKKNVSSVETGYECGIVLDNATTVEEGDIIKVFESVLVEPSTDSTLENSI